MRFDKAKPLVCEFTTIFYARNPAFVVGHATVASDAVTKASQNQSRVGRSEESPGRILGVGATQGRGAIMFVTATLPRKLTGFIQSFPYSWPRTMHSYGCVSSSDFNAGKPQVIVEMIALHLEGWQLCFDGVQKPLILETGSRSF